MLAAAGFGAWLGAGRGTVGADAAESVWPEAGRTFSRADVARADTLRRTDAAEDDTANANSTRAHARGGPRAEELEMPSERGARVRARPVADPDDERFALQFDTTAWALTVEDGRGNPLPGAHAAAFAIRDGVPHVPALCSVDVGRDGLAYLRVPASEEVYVVAWAERGLPVARTLRPESTSRAQLEPFVLEPGESIRGSVTVAGEPLERAQVDAEPLATFLPLDGERGSLGWRMGRFVSTRASAETRVDGTYTVTGLEPGVHRVRVATVRARDAAVDVTRILPRQTEAPSTGIDFELPGARLELAFETAAQPLCCVDLQIQAGDRIFMRRTDDHGRIAMRVQPATEYPLVAMRSGYETRQVVLHGLSDGGRDARTIELAPQTRSGAFEFKDGLEWGQRPNAASFLFHERFARGATPDFERTSMRDPTTGHFHVNGIPTGSWRVSVRMGNGWAPVAKLDRRPPEPIRETCDTELTLDVPEGVTSAGPRVVEFDPQPRGWLILNTRSSNGERVAPRIGVFDGNGEAVEFATNERFPGTWDPATELCSTVTRGPIEVRTQACAGAIDLVVSAPGHGTVRRHVSLVMGQATGVDVVLPRD